jgi:serine protease DegQ
MASVSSETAGILQGLSNDLAGAVERAGAAVVAVHGRQKYPSSGIYWRAGVIVTADHTVERDADLTVAFADGTKAKATLAGRDPSTDIAVLKVEGASAAAAEIGDAAALKVGHLALAVGRGEGGLGVSLGVVSSLSGQWNTWRGGQIDQFIRADVTFYPGFSGGPLVDAAGQVIGVNTSGLSRSMGLTIPASTVNRVVEQLLTKGTIARGYLGLGLQPIRLPETIKSALGTTSEAGLIVVSVDQGGPADTAGVVIGDILVTLGGTAVTDTDAVQAALGPDRIGTPLTAKIARGGQPKELEIAVGERPQRGGA